MVIKTEKRKKIADAARELFTEFGYKSVSMDQIAQKAGVAKGTLYLYFKDKNDLLNQLVDELFGSFKDFIKNVENNKLQLIQELHEIVYNFLMYRHNQKFLFRIAKEAEELKTPEACNVIETIDKEIAGYIEDRLDVAVKEGVIKSCDTSILAFVIIKVYSALAFEWEEKHAPLDEHQIAESVSLFLKDGLLNK
ncbi:MAG TPA: TetR/AcrR family transcriptional regulator [Ruminiclostridium sp.]|nr:TetR/AcrR family transcriptional regulator [Ruminiclostridium sp.]